MRTKVAFLELRRNKINGRVSNVCISGPTDFGKNT